MKQFKFDDYKKYWDDFDDGGGVMYLQFPRVPGDWYDYFISIYRPNEMSGYECELFCEDNECQGDRMHKGKFSNTDEITGFVDECFKIMYELKERYVVGGIIFSNYEDALKKANGSEIMTVHGPYSSEKEYEFYEGEGMLTDRWGDDDDD